MITPLPLPQDKQYHAFLSYSSLDKDVAEDVLAELSERGLRVWFDDCEIQAGQYIRSELISGLNSSVRTIALFSPAFFGSEWTQLEQEISFQGDPMARRRPFIPVLIQQCKIPPHLSGMRYIDARSGFSVSVIDKICRALL